MHEPKHAPTMWEVRCYIMFSVVALSLSIVAAAIPPSQVLDTFQVLLGAR